MRKTTSKKSLEENKKNKGEERRSALTRISPIRFSYSLCLPSSSLSLAAAAAAAAPCSFCCPPPPRRPPLPLPLPLPPVCFAREEESSST
jgi:hypothetical protein